MSTDPRFPDRPDHPDFWLISQALIDTDAQADAGQDVGDITDRIVDPASLIYVAQQRATRVIGSGQVPSSIALGLLATWMDAFVAGACYQRLKDAKAQEFDVPDHGNSPRQLRCRCGEYIATSEADMDEHVAAMVHVDDGLNHGAQQ